MYGVKEKKTIINKTKKNDKEVNIKVYVNVFPFNLLLNKNRKDLVCMCHLKIALPILN